MTDPRSSSRPRPSTVAQFSPEPFKPILRTRRTKSPSALERERNLLPHLPQDEVDLSQKSIRTFLWTIFYKFVLITMHILYGAYLRIRWAYNTILNRAFSVLYYHHRTPQLIEKDVRELKEKGKFPKHISVILDYENGDLDKLIDEVSEISCWCASAGIPRLSVYERTGTNSFQCQTSISDQ
jgi:dehydrodolichyl diphosphate syntase complex subunit NUS1